jgi:hypothetical protein
LNPISRAHQRFFKLLIIALTGVIAAAEIRAIRHRRTPEWIGRSERAWKATYAERGLHVPPRGPRDGIGMKELRLRPNRTTGSRVDAQFVPNLLDVDRKGIQKAIRPAHPRATLLIVGASVAFGTYSTTTRRTYFNQLAMRLAQLHCPVEINVLATGGWTSFNELKAFQDIGLGTRPDIVLFLDGLNDITLPSSYAADERVRVYLDHLRKARDLALKHGIQVVFAPQPLLLAKRVKSPLEESILRHPFTALTLAEIERCNRAQREGLRRMLEPGRVFMIDCTKAFDAEEKTVFADFWHFTDVGQAQLAKTLAEQLRPIISSR